MAGKVQGTVNVNFTSNIKELMREMNELNKQIKDMEKNASSSGGGLNAKDGFYSIKVNQLKELQEQYNVFQQQMQNSDDNLDTSSYQNLSSSLLNIVSSGKLSAGTLNTLAGSAGLSKTAIGSLAAVLGLSVKALNSFKNDFLTVGETLKNIAGDGFDAFEDGISGVLNCIDELCTEIERLTDVGYELQEGFFTVFNYAGAEAGESILQLTDALQGLYGIDGDAFAGDMRGILSIISNMGVASEDILAYTEGMSNFVLDVSKFSGENLSAVMRQIETAVNMNVLNSRSALARALDLTDYEIKQFKALNTQEERMQFLMWKGEAIRGTYERWLNTSAGKVELLKNQYAILNGELGKLVINIVALVAPMLTNALKIATQLVSTLSGILGFDLKDAEANEAGEGLFNDISESIDNVGESAEKAKKQVASFDDVIQLNDKSKNGENEISFSMGDLSGLEDWLNGTEKAKSAIELLCEELDKLLKDGKYYEAGKLLAETLSGLLTDVPWDLIQVKSQTAGAGLAQFINGLLADSELFYLIGETFAEGINTAFEFLYGFATNFDFKQLGLDLVNAWDGFWNGLDPILIGDTLYEYFVGAFELLGGWLEGDGLESLADTISNIIIDFFSNFDATSMQGVIDINEYADNIIGLIDEIFNAVGLFTSNLKEHPEIKDAIMLFITRLFAGFKENSGEWGETANELIVGIMDFISEAINTADASGLSAGIAQFLEKLNLSEILHKWAQIKLDLFFISLKSTLGAGLDLVGTALAGTLGVIVGGIVGIILAAVSLLGEALWNMFLTVSDWGSQVGIAIRDVASFIGSAIVSLAEKIKLKGTEIWNSIKGVFAPENWRTLAVNAFKALFNGLSSVWNNIRNWWNTTVAKDISFSAPSWLGGQVVKIAIPRLATGGIVSKSTIANIGEDGKEAVVPLEKNTGWMDTLATKLASQINAPQGNGGSITLDMSGMTKNFYTRNEMLEFAEHVVEALKLYGVKVATVY